MSQRCEGRDREHDHLLWGADDLGNHGGASSGSTFTPLANLDTERAHWGACVLDLGRDEQTAVRHRDAQQDGAVSGGEVVS